jgi:hypothetical protein
MTFLDSFSKKKPKYQILSKSIQWESSSTRADNRTDTQTDMTKIMVVFRNFANAPINDNVS